MKEDPSVYLMGLLESQQGAVRYPEAHTRGGTFLVGGGFLSFFFFGKNETRDGNCFDLIRKHLVDSFQGP